MIAVRCLLLVLLVSTLASCAAMFSGTKGEVLFSAVPAEGTSVRVGEDVYAIDNVPRKIKKSTKEVVFSNPSYGDYIVPVKRSFQGGFLLMDILFTPGYGLVGVIVDGGTSAWFKLPSSLQFDFTTEIAKQSNDKDASGTKIARTSLQEAAGGRATTSNAKPVSAGSTGAARP